MTRTQKQALHAMSELHLGAIRVESGWVWPEDIRQSEDVANAVLRTIFLNTARGTIYERTMDEVLADGEAENAKNC